MSKKPTISGLEARIADLEAERRQHVEKIKELRADLTEAHDLVNRLREHAEDDAALREQWIEAFDMETGEDGLLHFSKSGSEGAWDEYAELAAEHQKLVAEWNRNVTDFNRTIAKQREPGRPLAASDEQVASVLALHKNKASLREIVAATSLGIRTVRTIVGRKESTDRTSKRRNDLRRLTFNKLRAARYRAKIKARDEYLPKRLAAVQDNHAALMKAAKGLGKAGGK